MKKLLKVMTFSIALGALLISNFQVSHGSDNSLKIDNVSNVAEAQDDPYTRACDKWCLPSGNLCVLELATGGELYCFLWEEPPIVT